MDAETDWGILMGPIKKNRSKEKTMRHCEYYFNNMPNAAVESTTTARTLVLELVCSPHAVQTPDHS